MNFKEKLLSLFRIRKTTRTTADIKIEALKDVRNWEAKVYKDLALEKTAEADTQRAKVAA